MSLLSNLLGGQNTQPLSMPNNGPLSGIMNMARMMQKFKQFANSPVEALLGMNPNLNIPQNLMNNPEAAVKHLISTGQMSQEQFNQLSQAANQVQSMFPKF